MRIFGLYAAVATTTVKGDSNGLIYFFFEIISAR